jgi:hypothetical protein
MRRQRAISRSVRLSLRLEMFLPVGLKEFRVVFYFGKVCPHFGQLIIWML